MKVIFQTLLVALTITLIVVTGTNYIHQSSSKEGREKELEDYKRSFSWKDARYDYISRLHEGYCNENESEYSFTQDGGEPYMISQFVDLSTDFTTEFAISTIEPDVFTYESPSRNCPNYEWIDKMSKRALYNLLNTPFDYENNGASGRRMMVEGTLIRGIYWDIDKYTLKRSDGASYEAKFQPDRTTKTRSFSGGIIDNISYKLQNTMTTKYYKVIENEYNIKSREDAFNIQLATTGVFTFLLSCMATMVIMKKTSRKSVIK
jgi:hypothetical protein